MCLSQDPCHNPVPCICPVVLCRDVFLCFLVVFVLFCCDVYFVRFVMTIHKDMFKHWLFIQVMDCVCKRALSLNTLMVRFHTIWSLWSLMHLRIFLWRAHNWTREWFKTPAKPHSWTWTLSKDPNFTGFHHPQSINPKRPLGEPFGEGRCLSKHVFQVKRRACRPRCRWWRLLRSWLYPSSIRPSRREGLLSSWRGCRGCRWPLAVPLAFVHLRGSTFYCFEDALFGCLANYTTNRSVFGGLGTIWPWVKTNIPYPSDPKKPLK